VTDVVQGTMLVVGGGMAHLDRATRWLDTARVPKAAWSRSHIRHY
jgi:hypothetical protein